MDEIITVIFFSLIVSIWAIQISSESVLALRIKNFFKLSHPYNKKLIALCQFKTWRRMLGTISYVLLPIIVLIIIPIRLHRFIAEVLECPYCLSYHLGWLSFYFIIKLPLWEAFYLATLPILWIYIIDRIKG